jgi:hypothetical protein
MTRPRHSTWRAARALTPAEISNLTGDPDDLPPGAELAAKADVAHLWLEQSRAELAAAAARNEAARTGRRQEASP